MINFPSHILKSKRKFLMGKEPSNVNQLSSKHRFKIGLRNTCRLFGFTVGLPWVWGGGGGLSEEKKKKNVNLRRKKKFQWDYVLQHLYTD